MSNFTALVPSDNVDAPTVNSRLQELSDAIDDRANGSEPLASPEITSFVNAQHDHTDPANGGQIPLSGLAQSGATTGQLVKWSGTEWEPSTELATITNKGDLLTRDASDLERLPVGANNSVLMADDAQPLGLKWDRPDPIATGTYTGNGAATQAITGTGFQPKGLVVYAQGAAANDQAFKTDQDGANARLLGVTTWNADHVISLDANGFTVGDGTGDSNKFNVNAVVYAYMAW